MKILRIIILLLVIPVFAFANGEHDQNPASSDDNFSGTTITWICSSQPSTDAAIAMIPEFEKETGIKVKVDLMDEVRMMEKLLLDKSMSTKQYDLVSIESTWIDMFIKENIIIPIDDLVNDSDLPVPGLDLDDYPTGLIEAQCTRNDQLWMVPFGCGTSFFAIRKDLFEEAGIPDPVTWEDVLAAAEKLTLDTNGDGRIDQYGISMRGQRGIHSVFVYYCIAQPMGFEHLDNQMNPLLNSDAAISGMEMYAKLAQFGPPGIPTWTHEEAATAFNEGLAAMFIDVSQLIPWIESEQGGKIKYLPLPKSAGSESYISTLSGWGIGIHGDSDAKEAAMRFIEYITSKRNADTFIENGGPIERISMLNDPDLIAEKPWLEYQLERYKVAKFAWPNITEIPEWNDILGKYITATLSGGYSAKSAMEKANEELSVMLKEAGY
jgi:multiple sugar transport system substrate-binding protein